jgi:hypothetical protein
MPTKIEITCFTDLKGSTTLMEQMGHQGFIPILQEHLRVGKSLAMRNRGSYVKNIGDAHMVRFENVEDALAFASQLQQLYRPRPGIVESPVKVRISLFQGPVEPFGDDVFGSGVNQASRLQEATEPGQVTINQDLYQTMKKVYGEEAADQYCRSIGTHELRGIGGEHLLYSFDWLKYTEATPDASLAISLHDHLRRANIEPSNISPADLNRPGQVIWPVVPRDLATAIHRGQIELIRLLALLGWEVVVLIADCGAETDYEDDYVEQFKQSIESHVALRKVRLSQILRMSALYEPTYSKYRHIQALFRRITSQMTVEVLMSINTKRYPQDVRTEITQKPTLTYLRPPLTLAAVLHLAENAQTKCAVIAGSDEELQWSQAYNLPDARMRLGVLMIPVLNMDPEHQMYQRKRWPFWHSEDEVIRASVGSNVPWWLFRLLAFLPAFPDSAVMIGDKNVQPGDWTDQLSTPTEVELSKLISHIWPILSPA